MTQLLCPNHGCYAPALYVHVHLHMHQHPVPESRCTRHRLDTTPLPPITLQTNAMACCHPVAHTCKTLADDALHKEQNTHQHDALRNNLTPCSAACTQSSAQTPSHGYSACSLAALAHAASIVVAASLIAPVLGARAIARRMRCTRDLPCAVPVVVVALLRCNGNDAQQLRLPQRTQGSLAANA